MPDRSCLSDRACTCAQPWAERREIGGCTLYRGDALAILPTLEAGTVDAIVTDPPYMVGSISVGNSKAKHGTWVDMENSAYWYAEWLRHGKTLLRPTGYFVVFGSWRSLPTLIRAFSLIEMSVTSAMVWDKDWIGPAYRNALRPRYEMVMFAACPRAVIPDRSAADIVRHKWQAGNTAMSGHPAEKPVPLLARLCELVAPAGGVVLDPFLGSGTTGVAAAVGGWRFVGIEREQKWFESACQRIATAVAERTP